MESDSRSSSSNQMLEWRSGSSLTLLLLCSVLGPALRLTSPSIFPSLQLPVHCVAEAGTACFVSCSGQTEVLKLGQGK